MITGRSTRSYGRSLLAAVLVAVVLCPSPVGAQMLGVPVLQNAFANPGFTVAANLSTESGATAYGLAAAWSPGGARFQISGGAGSFVPDEGSSVGTGGIRAMVPIAQFMGGSMGVAAFAGGGAASQDDATIVTVPVGAALGYRRALWGRGVSVYVAPFYSWSRASMDGAEAVSSGVVRASAGLDVGVFRSLGLTVGAEFGATPEVGEPGPTGTRFGVGVSYAFSS